MEAVDGYTVGADTPRMITESSTEWLMILAEQDPTFSNLSLEYRCQDSLLPGTKD
jgi:hypothetical protein